MKKYMFLRILLIFGVASLLCLGPIQPVAAAWTTLTGEEVLIREGEEIDGDLWVFSRAVEIRGRIKGDLLIATEHLKVSGQIDGDLLGFAAQTELSGRVLGNLRLFSVLTNLNGEIAGNISAAGSELFLGPKATASSLLAWYTIATVAGEVKEAAYVKGTALTMSGQIGQDLKAGGTRVMLTQDAQVGGDLIYRAGIEPVLEPGAKVGGKLREFATPPPPGLTALRGVWFVGGLFLGVVWLLIFPHRWTEMMAMRPAWRRLIGLGLGGLIILPLLAFLASALVFGLPLGICLLLLFLILVFFGELPSYLLLGDLLFGALRKGRRTHPIVLFTAGGFVLTFLKILPYIGYFFSIAGRVVGNGLLLSYLFYGRKPMKPMNHVARPGG